ncbi:MAG TPA: MqnA/MqnD/SBP family protein [Rubricoccaceae bacterium]|nr:MqnA/MqnD/SBP family protein [Rubricoccaceae bacterium]
MRLFVWPVDAARALARAWAPAQVERVEGAPHEALAALLRGEVDLALVPTLDALRAADDLALVPGVGLVGGSSPAARLVVGGALDALQTVAFDPRLAQEALLTQVVLREHYDARPSFLPADPAASLADLLTRADAALVRPDRVGETDGALVLDLGQEWLDLTARPMVWGLVAARAGALGAKEARALRAAARRAVPPTEGAFVLDGYALGGLDAFADYLYAHGSLDDLPELPFVEHGEEAPEDDALDA